MDVFVGVIGYGGSGADVDEGGGEVGGVAVSARRTGSVANPQ